MNLLIIRNPELALAYVFLGMAILFLCVLLAGLCSRLYDCLFGDYEREDKADKNQLRRHNF